MPRWADFVVAAAAVAVLAPLLAVIAIAVKLTSPGPVLFRQDRLGKDGRIFRLFKFRTMRHRAPSVYNADGSSWSASDDPRVTPLGRFLRQSSLDELPQLFNVLAGHMSLVGPRPDEAAQLQHYTPAEHGKLVVRPGLTGLAQISGRNSISWQHRKQLDLEYVARRSAALDLQILLKTIPYVLLRKDVHQSLVRSER